MLKKKLIFPMIIFAIAISSASACDLNATDDACGYAGNNQYSQISSDISLSQPADGNRLSSIGEAISSDDDGSLELDCDALKASDESLISISNQIGTDDAISLSADSSKSSDTVKSIFDETPTKFYVAKKFTKVYGDSKQLVITVKDDKGNPVSGDFVEIILEDYNSEEYDVDTHFVKTNSKGQIILKCDFAPGKYGLTLEDLDSYAFVLVNVKKATPKIIAPNKAFKSDDKTKKYLVALKDNRNKAMKNVKVALTVGGKAYMSKTNAKGIAAFKLTSLHKTSDAVIKFAGDKYYNAVVKKTKLTVKASFKTVSKGCKDVKTVKKIQQALKNNGYYLTYAGHYLMVDGIYEDCTVRSVKQFQKANGLKVTGHVDELTARKLGII